MKTATTSSYQTFILFFSWSIGLIAVMVRMFVEIELTPIILAIALMDIAINFRKKNEKFNKYSYMVLVIIFIFYCWIISSNAYSPSIAYKYDKTLNFIANVIFFIYPFFMRRINFDLLIKLYCIIVLPLSVYFVYMNSLLWKVNTAGTELFMSIRSAYLVVGMQLGILFLMLLFFKKNILLKIFTFSLLVASGGRGPLLLLIFVVFIYLIAERKITFPKPKNILQLVFTISGLFTIYFLKADAIDSLLAKSMRRFSSLLSGNDISALERINMMQFAFNQPFEKLSTFLFGNGIGSFGVLFRKTDQRLYPHNVLLESFFELGIIGLLIFVFLFILIFRKISFKKNVFGLTFLFIFLNAMKSSNITDLWILFSMMGCIISMDALQLRTNEHEAGYIKSLET